MIEATNTYTEIRHLGEVVNNIAGNLLVSDIIHQEANELLG